jgi:glycosyltransferase involved in cell wall biosynthesis
MDPLVSVVIPTRNRPELVCSAVRSALNQSYRNLEVVVVVDGPDQATVEILEAFQEPRLRIVALPENVGGSEARNIGVRSAEGEWIALLDDDDEWLPEKIDKQLAMVATKGYENALIACYYYFRSSGKTDLLKPRRQPRPNEDVAGYIFEPYCALTTSTYVCRRDLFLTVPFDPTLPCLQDFDWYLRVMNRRDVRLIVIPEPLSIYNDPSDRVTISAKRTWESVFQYAKSHRSLMTKRIYARFITKCCVRLAVRQKAGSKAVFELFAEMFRHGSPSLETVALFFLFCLKT